MNKNLRKYFYSLFDEGNTDFSKLQLESPDLIYFLRSQLMMTLPKSELEDYLCESISCEDVNLYPAIQDAYKDISNKSYANVGQRFLIVLGARLDNLLVDLFNEALENYNISNILDNFNSLKHQENEIEINQRCDYNQRYRDSQ